MNDSIPVPRDIVSEILGWADPKDLSAQFEGVYESLPQSDSDMDPEATVPLTLTQVGELFRLAWLDLENEGRFDMSKAVEGTTPLEFAMGGSIESEERLRSLMIWASKGIPKAFTYAPCVLLTAEQQESGCFVIKRKSTNEVVAQMVFHPASFLIKRKALWRVSFTEEEFSEEEMHEVTGILGRLNEQIPYNMGFRLYL